MHTVVGDGSSDQLVNITASLNLQVCTFRQSYLPQELPRDQEVYSCTIAVNANFIPKEKWKANISTVKLLLSATQVY